MLQGQAACDWIAKLGFLRRVGTLLITMSFEVANAKFYQPQFAPHKSSIANYDQAVQSSIGFQTIGMSTVARCSGTVISHSGFVVSARHCFDRCFDENLALSDPESTPGANTLFYVDRSKFPITCQVIFGGNLEEVEVVESGDCKLGEPNDVKRTTSSEYADLRAAGCGSGGDFAIFKFKTPHQLNCSRARPREMKPSDAVWAVGYPAMTNRLEGYNSDGTSKYVSFGKVTSGLEENQDYKALVSADSPFNLVRPYINLLKKN